MPVHVRYTPCEGKHRTSRLSLNKRTKGQFDHLVKFFYPPDQVRVTGGVLKKHVICNTEGWQKSQRGFCPSLNVSSIMGVFRVL